MPEEKKEKGLKATTVWLMIGTALFFDALQILLDFILMGWLVTILASMTFWLWFKFNGISFMKPKRLIGGIVTILIDVIPVLGWFAWTVSITSFALSLKIQKIVPGANITKLGIIKK
ncbi:MAG: hypothetical protein HYX23_01935 [Candidatus Zambryskibacteria bacterium]|nr:hypothetical protein [Candidatus Zambryskibacteria bacterium]